MKVFVNGEETEVREEIVLSSWIDASGLNPKTLLIEHNGQIIPKSDWKKVVLRDADRLELLQFVGGG